ncbi:MAG: flavodoxin family protein [Promethearchaeota archaeon]
MNKKTLIVFYSHDGNTKFIAETLAEELNADILTIQPRKELQGTGFKKFFWGGKQSMMRQKPELESFEINPNDYSQLILGTPVWAWSLCPPMRSFLSNNKIMGKKIALYCCCMGNSGKTFKQMQKYLPNNEIVGHCAFIEPLINNLEENKGIAKKWIRDLNF